MKGSKHNVIEINDTQNDSIDRILVFLKPEAKDVAVMTTRAQAAEILKELDVKKSRRLSKKAGLWLLAAAENSSYLSVAICFAAFLANDLYGFVSWRSMERRQAAAC